MDSSSKSPSSDMGDWDSDKKIQSRSFQPNGMPTFSKPVLEYPMDKPADQDKSGWGAAGLEIDLKIIIIIIQFHEF